ncbi:MAG TPA: hypothetical protein VK537_09280 [Galbitalea sp.]|nr:hypothetical protein [Galbitalea sp.]
MTQLSATSAAHPADPSSFTRLVAAGGQLTADVDPRGARLATLVHRDSGRDALLHTAWEHEDWSGAFPATDSSAEWHRRYQGGWHVLAPHVGAARVLAGVEHPYHGEAAWRPWRVTDVTENSCALEVLLRTVPLRLRREFVLTDDAVQVVQHFVNLSSSAVSFSWTEHPAFGDALIDETSEVSVGGERVDVRFPRQGERHGGFATFDATGDGQFAIRNPRTRLEALVEWDAELLPYASAWQEHNKTQGFPWWGTTNTIGLEPASRDYHDVPSELGPLIVEPRGTLSSALKLSFRSY